MAKITLKGNPINTSGNISPVGTHAHDFVLTKTDLSDVSLSDFSGKKLILNIFPSIDTATCAMSVRTFNEKAAQVDNVIVLCISADLPFAQARFCGAEGIKNVVSLSDFRHKEFGEKYGLRISDGPLAGLLSRAVIVLNQQGEIVYSEQVAEIANEPDYDAAINAIA